MPLKLDENNQLSWKPNNPKQAQFLALPTWIFEALMGGGAGSGKSEVLMMYGIVRGWHSHPRFKQLFLRRTYPEINREIIPRSRDMYAPLGAKFNKADRRWTFPRDDQYGSGFEPEGGIIQFGHCENEDDVHNYDGMEINLFTPDEITSYTEYIYNYIAVQRVRSAVPELPAIVRASGMPGDVGHSFVKKRFIDPFPKGGKVIVGRANNKRIYIHTTASDNKDGDPEYLQRLEAITSEAERKAKKYGDWSTYEGQVFDELRDKRYAGEPDNAIHVITPFLIPKHWPRVCSIDWGYSALCSVGWGAVSPNRRLFVYRHQTFQKEKIEIWAPKVKQFVDEDAPSDVVICHSATQNRGDSSGSILEQVIQALDRPVRVGTRDRVADKVLIHEYLRWEPRVNPVPKEVGIYDHDFAMWIRRNKSEKEFELYLKSFAPEPGEDNLPKLQFFNHPDILLITDALKACIYAKSGKDGKKREDVAEFEGDDPYDMLRMLVKAADDLVSVSKEITEAMQAKDRVEEQLRLSSDMTAYYRNMRKLESLENPAPIKRFHGRYTPRYRH